MTYLVAAYAKDDSLYPADIRVRAMVDQRLQFDLGTLYQRFLDYYVIHKIFLKKSVKELKTNLKIPKIAGSSFYRPTRSGQETEA